MKLKKLSIENFGVYGNRHEFSLQVHSKNGSKKQNLIIVKGPNGAGKTTLYRSITLALFGRLAIGSKVSNREYKKYIESRLHKSRNGNSTNQSSTASIQLDIDFVQSGVKKEIKINRSWNKEAGSFESLIIFVDGETPEVQEVDYQSWLNDLIPVGLKHILCFDAEDMNSLLNDDNDNEDELRKVIKRLLGINLVEQLDDDLSYYLRNAIGGSNFDHLKDKVVTLQTYIDGQVQKVESKRKIQDSLELKEKDHRSKLAELERELSSQGGDYAARRPIIKERITQLNKEIIQLETKLQDLSAGLLPFAFAPILSQKLKTQLDTELDSYRQMIASDYLSRKLKALSEYLKSSSIWKEHSVDSSFSEIVINELKEILNKEGVNKISLLHELSENDVLKIQKWINEASENLPNIAIHFSEDLQKKKEEKSEHQEYLDRAPDEEHLEPIFEEIRGIENSLAAIRKENKTLLEEIGSIQYKLEEAVNEQESVATKLREVEKESRRYHIAHRSQDVLKAYSKKLASSQLQELSDQLVFCFNRICDKEQLLLDASIDPATYKISLLNHHEEEVSISDFSMGEKQIYSLALLWALRIISDFDLPLLIDTPIARLDKVHQANFIKEFIPEVSDQIVLFTTNVEMNKDFEDKLDPAVAQIYKLEFNDEVGSTKVNGIGHKYEDEKLLSSSK